MVKKKYYIITYGCQMNKSDSERVAAMLEKNDYKPAKSEKEADLIVVNACSVRQSAVDRIYGKVRQFAKLKTYNLKLKTILTGCVLPQDKKKFIEKFDLVLDLKDWDKFSILNSQFLNEIENRKSKIGNKKYKIEDTGYFHIQPHYTERFRAYIPIMTGCNNFCSYCAVPYVRGREVSRNVAEVLLEVRNLAEKGYLEVTLLGQNVNAYQPTDIKNFSKKNLYKHPFAALLWEVNKIPGIRRIFFTAAHPRDMTDEVIDALTLPKMVNYLHLPVQAGDDKVLKRMNRHYTAADYLKLIKKIRKKKPEIALGTDIIVGFPGETKKAFQNTVDLYKEADFDIAYLAMYSPRSGTAAAKLIDDVPYLEKKWRWEVLQNLMKKITLEKNKKYVGKKVSVLVDEYRSNIQYKSHDRGICITSKKSEKEEGEQCIGNSREMKRVRFSLMECGDCSAMDARQASHSRHLANTESPLQSSPRKERFVGKIFDVKIKKAFEWILEGEVR